MWSFQNPVKIIFGPNEFCNLDKIIAGRKYGLITYPNSPLSIGGPVQTLFVLLVVVFQLAITWQKK